jgi:hypothetical protein
MTTSSQSLEPPGQGPGEGLFLPADDLEDAQNMMDYANQQRRAFQGDATTEEEVFHDYDDLHATDEQEHGITGGTPLPDTPVPDEATTTQPDATLSAFDSTQEDESNPVPYEKLRAALKDDTYDLSPSELESAWDNWSMKTGGSMSDDDLLSYIKQTTQSTYNTVYGAPTSTDTPLGGLDDNNNSDDTPPSTSDTPPTSLPEQPPAPELEHNQYHLNQREAPAHVHQDIIYDERDAQSLSGYKRSTRRHARVGDIAILAQFN